VLATQTLPQVRPETMAVTVEGDLPPGVTAKDMVLHIIGVIGTGGGAGHMIEYRGPAIRALSMEGRMTVCNMSIEGGAKAGMIARTRPPSSTSGPTARPEGELWDAAVEYWKTLVTDDGAVFDKEVVIDATSLVPTSPGAPTPHRWPHRRRRALPDSFADEETVRRPPGARLHGLEGGTPIRAIPSTRCSSARAPTLASRTCVRRQRSSRAGTRAAACGPGGAGLAQGEGPGRSRGARRDLHEGRVRMAPARLLDVLAMNPDKLAPGERCASTSNRNFEGRQGRGGQTHLVSPAVAAATAIAGHFATPEEVGA